MAIIVERKVGVGDSDRGDVRFNNARTASLGPTDGSEGDVWYDKIRLRFLGKGLSTIHKGFGGRYGPEFGSRGQQQISGGAVNISNGWTELLSETGVSDTLDTINIFADLGPGDSIVLSAVTGHTITVSDSTGNLRLDGGANKVLNTINDMLVLAVNFDGTKFVQLSFSNNPL